MRAATVAASFAIAIALSTFGEISDAKGGGRGGSHSSGSHSSGSHSSGSHSSGSHSSGSKPTGPHSAGKGKSGSSSSSSSKNSSSGSGTGSNSSSHSVRGYNKKDGTHVDPHHATNPNSTKRDNYSSKPNVNPHNGKEGTKDADK